ncbi:MAG TPA: sterol desaturase family protein [Acidobacteriota bacterium]|nr:sterol desaturase family protein [Acidobacteriota bacterium]
MKTLIWFAAPAFALLILLETLYDLWQKTHEYEVKDTVTNITLGFVSMFMDLGWKLFIQVPAYWLLYNLTPLRIPQTWWSWGIVMILVDFAYYWFHRFSHESRFFWNFHVVHHSSEHYNLSVAVRQSWFGGAVSWVFYAPIALMGFDPMMIITAYAINLIYQFWIHTKFIKSLGPLEAILNTPAHHRVHHGVNEPYLDKNYAGMLIIWDRMFGSFTPEIETPRYGIIKPLRSFNPVWANFHAWVEMFETMRTRVGLGEKLRCIWSAPAMLPKAP